MNDSTVSGVISLEDITQLISGEKYRGVISAVVAGYEYRWFFGMAIPYMTFVDLVGPGAFPLLGHIMIEFDETHRCSSCMREIPEHERLCAECAALPLNKRLSCILDGPGVPFGEECTLESPACGEDSWAQHVCYAQWIVYIAEVFGVLKVGISRKDHGGCSVGFTQRLLTQGAGRWLALSPVQSLNEALELEDRISRELRLSQRVTSRERWGFLITGEAPPKLPMQEIHEWLVQNDMSIYMAGNFTPYYIQPAEMELIHAGDKDDLYGRVVLNRGPMIGLADDMVRVHDLSRLTGRAIVGDI
ncbi:MAG: DUF2797 domain-containing protein [Methanosarcinales archaeon]